jgi:hypothetical protein
VRTGTQGFEGNQTCHKGLGIVCGTWGRLGGPGETEIAELSRDRCVRGGWVPNGCGAKEETDLEVAVGV